LQTLQSKMQTTFSFIYKKAFGILKQDIIHIVSAYMEKKFKTNLIWCNKYHTSRIQHTHNSQSFCYHSVMPTTHYFHRNLYVTWL